MNRERARDRAEAGCGDRCKCINMIDNVTAMAAMAEGQRSQRGKEASARA